MRLLFAVLCLLFPIFSPIDVQAQTGRFLAMADLHFDPLSDPGLTNQLTLAPAAEWADLLAGGAASGFGRDTDWTLLNQILDEMRQVEPHPDFLLIPGDFMAHRLDRRFRQARTRDDPTQLVARDDPTFLNFEAKTLQVIVQQTQQRFPGVPILPVLGNNDDSCGDYRGNDNDATMSSTLPLLRAMLGSAPGGSLPGDWTRLGSYDVALPNLPHLHLIGLDDVFFSAHYKPCADATDQRPDATLLAWLRDHLSAARQGGYKVWLMMHIPPGADVFGTVTGPACPAASAPMWQAADLAAYTGLIDGFADVIAAQFAGHTHMAEFRLAGENSFVIGVPGVSPIYFQNPAFELYTYRPDGALTDRTTVAFSNFADVTRAPAPAWHRQDFDAAWSITALDAGTLRDVARRLTDRPPTSNPDLAHYLLDYSTGHQGVWAAQQIDPMQAARTMACSAAHIAAEPFDLCRCSGG